MDEWCELVSAYPGVPEPKHLAKALRIADNLLSKDLAPFEIDWFVATLFFKPVNICATVTSKKDDEAWAKNIGDAFKVISKIVCKYWNHLENYYEHIAELCQLPLDTKTKKEALNCLINFLKNPGVGIENAHVYINALERNSTCLVPLALLLGTICRYYPEIVAREYIRIWRIYLKLFQTNKTTDTVDNAVLQGVDGLFMRFGSELPTNEMNTFYVDLIRKCTKRDKCFEPLLSILKSHAGLFKENLAKDQALRRFLWESNNPNIKDALLSIYTVVFNEVPFERVMNIIKTEVEPKLDNYSSVVRHTALRILMQAKVKHDMTTVDVFRPDALEFHLRNRPITHQEADLISLCFESTESYVKSLLQTAIAYYDNLPASLRQDVVVKGLLGPNKECRKVALNFLIELSRQQGLNKFCDVWRAALNDDVEGEAVLDEVVHQMAARLLSFLNAEIIDLDQVLSLTAVLSFVLSASEKEDKEQYCSSLRPSIVELAATLCVPPASLLTPQFVCVEMFEHKTLLRELSFEDKYQDCLSVMQDLFSKDVVDTKLLIKAVSKMDDLLKTEKDLDQRRVSYIMKQILKLKSRRDESTSEDRVLRRSLSMFIGEHNSSIKRKEFIDETTSMELKNKIYINIPNVTDVTNYKIDLLPIISLGYEDSEMLYCLLVILTVNFRVSPDPGLQSMMWRCIHGLFRCGSHVDVAPVLRMCATAQCVQQAIDSITEEINPEVRRMLCSSLQVMLLQDPGSDTTRQTITMVAKQLVLMISDPDQQNYDCGIDIARILLSTVQNDALIIEYLPKIIVLTSRKIVVDLFNTATNLFIDTCDIFDDGHIFLMISGIIGSVELNSNKIEVQCILKFLRKLIDLKKYDNNVLVEDIFGLGWDTTVSKKVGILANVLQILALSKPIFEFDTNTMKSVILKNNCAIINVMARVLSDGDRGVDEERSVLEFLKEFAPDLVDIKREETIGIISSLIESLSTESVATLRKPLLSCLNTYKDILNVLPNEIMCSHDKLCNKLHIQEINEIINGIENLDEFSVSDSIKRYIESIRTLGILSGIIDCPMANTETWTQLLLSNYNKLPPAVVSDLLLVSNKTLSNTDFEMILKNNVSFVTKYLDVYLARILLTEPVVLDKILLVDVVKKFANNYESYKKYCENMLSLLENNWSRLQDVDTEVKLSLASDILQLPIHVGLIPPVRWVLSFIANENTNLDLKIRLITSLPGGDECSSCYRHLAGSLPNRLSEMRGNHAAIFRALLDSLASTGDLTLLDIIVTLAAADESKGWWEDAIRVCMESLAEKRDEKIYEAAYDACKKRYGLGGCVRVFVPLLKYSTPKFCEDYVKNIIQDVLFTFTRFEEPTNSIMYRDRIYSYAKAFSILQTVIERLPVNKLESGVINSSAGSPDPWYLVKKVCQYSVTLRNKVQCPENAGHGIPDAYLRLQCAAYNCLTTAICKRRPAQKTYKFVFDVSAWAKIVDPHVEHEFQRTYWTDNRTKKQSDEAQTYITSSYISTVRTRIFMDTPSENPLQIDMIPLYEDENAVEEDKPLGYENHPLNEHGCLTAITALLEHASTLEHMDWLTTLKEGLTTILPLNAKWTLAQAICNADMELKPHANVLAPALLELIATTPKVTNGKRLLNNLHIDILWTIIKWDIPDLSSYEHLNSCLEYLISSCLEYTSQKSFYRWLLSTINRLLQVYSTKVTVQWSLFQQYDLISNAAHLLPIFQRILSNGIPLPELLPAMFNFQPNQWASTSKLPEVFGLALALVPDKDNYLSKFWHNLQTIKAGNLNAFVKVLMYAQKACPQCCDDRRIRAITDLAPKIEKSKCLKIIALYLENLHHDDGFCGEMFETISLMSLLNGDDSADAMKVVLGGLRFMDESMRREMVIAVAQNCRNGSLVVRKQAFEVILKAFQDLFLVKEEAPVVKRRAMHGTPILDTVESQTSYHRTILEEICRGLFHKDETIAVVLREGVEKCLSKDMAIRLAELYYLIFYFAEKECTELLDYGYVFLDLLFSDLKKQEAFRNIKLSDEPLPACHNNGGHSISSTAVMSGQKQAKVNPTRDIDTQILVADVFEVFLQSAKGNSEICQELCVQVMRRLQGSSRRFDLNEVMAKLLADILKKQPNCLTPLFLETSRIFLNGVTSVDGFKSTLNVMKKKLYSCDAVSYFNVLHEDLLLRTEGRSLFDFSIKEDLDIEMRDDNQQFSIEVLIQVFGDLSNWDDIKYQDKARVEQLLPPLLVQEVEFKDLLTNYFQEKETTLDYSLWFNKVGGAYYSNKVHPIIQYKEKWLRDIELWPKREFVTSAVIEAIKWPQDDVVKACDIKPSDCLGEWAARLMVRAAYYGDDARSAQLCRQDELTWCSEANRRNLPHLALQCIERNRHSFLDDEVLSWFHQKVEAHRMIALRQHDSSMLQKALLEAEKHDNGDSICLTKVILQLQNDLGLLSRSKLKDVLANVNSAACSTRNGILFPDAKYLKSVYDIAMNYYDESWDGSDVPTQEEIINDILNVIEKVLDHNLSREHNLLVSILLNRLTCFKSTLSEETAKKVLEMFVSMLPNLDSFSVSTVVQMSTTGVFPSDVWSQYKDLFKEESLGLCKEYLHLICHPQYTLIQCCQQLMKTTDSNTWKNIFDQMKKRFESSHVGTDYITLNTIKNKLYAIDFDTANKQTLLMSILKDLMNKPDRRVLLLSQLSRTLSVAATLESQRENLRKLLGLPPTVYVEKFSEQVQVYMDSLKRPCVISAELSNGVTKKYIIKTGDPLANDASVQRAIAVLPQLFDGQIRSYNVTTLSEESAVIEYLEDHERLAELIGKKEPFTTRRNDYPELSTEKSLEEYTTQCNKLPISSLRSAIENGCATIEQFISKKRMFMETLSTMTITNWLFGLGDRHLDNIMLSTCDGSIVAVDWASVFQYGLSEYVPARLTANLLAVCDVKVLESRLQTMLVCLRENRRAYEAFVKCSFYWKGRDFYEMMYIENILQGMVSYQITRDVMENSAVKNKEARMTILDSVFKNLTRKSTYSVEEQVSCLLQHCTDVRLLSVIRREWMAWV